MFKKIPGEFPCGSNRHGYTEVAYPLALLPTAGNRCPGLCVLPGVGLLHLDLECNFLKTNLCFDLTSPAGMMKRWERSIICEQSIKC